jgi:hypothetical protein
VIFELTHRSDASRRAGQELETTRQAFDRASTNWIEHGAEIAGRFTERIDYQSCHIDQMEQRQQERHAYLEQHPDLVQHIGHLDHAISRADELERHHRHERELQRLDLGHSLGDDHELHHSPDTGLGL